MADQYAPLPMGFSPQVPVYGPGSPVALPVAPMPLPTSTYQGLLDRLHLAHRGIPAATPVPASLPTLPAPPSSQGLPSLSDLLQGLKDLVNRWLTPSAPPAGAPPPKPAARKTEFVISSFNVLGSSHTKGPGSDRPSMAPGVVRIRKVADLLERHDVDVVGFQEFQRDQFTEFKKVAGDTFAVYPGFKLGKPEVVNSIAWRKETWDLVKGDFIDIPYFNGQTRKMPVVRLRHKETGQEAYFANFHNPASTRKQGDQEKWRDLATQKEIDLVNRLRQQTGLPVFVTGDMNERDEYYDKMTRQTEMVSADTGPKGQRPKSMGIDWIFGSSDVKFSGYQRDRSAQVKQASDHPIIVSKARITG